MVAFAQGAAVGAMIRGIPVANGQYAGGSFGWLHPFAILTGIGLVLGYALLGAGWLVLKSDGELRDWAHRRIRWLTVGVFGVLLVAFTATFDYSVLARSNLLIRPWALAFPGIALLALVGILLGARSDRDQLPFAMTCLFFLAAFLSLGLMFWPYMIPYSVTVASAAAPDASLRFLFYGGVVVLPVIAAYTIGVYWVFRGKIGKTAAKLLTGPTTLTLTQMPRADRIPALAIRWQSGGQRLWCSSTDQLSCWRCKRSATCVLVLPHGNEMPINWPLRGLRPSSPPSVSCGESIR